MYAFYTILGFYLNFWFLTVFVFLDGPRLFCIKTMLWLETGLLSRFSQGQSMGLQSIHWKLLMSICLSTFLLPNTRTCIVHTNEGLSRKHTLQQSMPSRYKTPICLSIHLSVCLLVCLVVCLLVCLSGCFIISCFSLGFLCY